MPAIISPKTSSPLSPRSSPAKHPLDWELLCILVIVASILIAELILAIGSIRWHNLRSKARWKRLREHGVVIVSGPALLWAGDIPVPRQVSYFNLRAAAEASKIQLRDHVA